MSNDFRGAIALTGGAPGALDAIDGAGLANLDGAFVVDDFIAYLYSLDADSAAAESSPTVITPDANAGNKRWILESLAVNDLTTYGATIFNNSEADKDFRVAATGATNALFVQGSDGFIGVGKNNPATELDIVGNVTIEAAKLKVGTTTPTATQWGALGALVEWTDWTPNITNDADLSGYNTARYYRIGDICFFTFIANSKNVTTGGQIQVTLPFTSANTNVHVVYGKVSDGVTWLVSAARIETNTNHIKVPRTFQGDVWIGNETDVYVQLGGFFEIV